MGENPLNEGVNEIENGAVKNIADALKNASVNSVEGTIGESESGENNASGSINDFLHQEVTWQSFKNFLFKEVPITYKGKRIF